MFSFDSVPQAPGVRSAVAGAVLVTMAAFCGVGVRAQQTLEPVLVTATRVPQALRTSPVGATVISADQIQSSGVADANEAIRKLGGVASKTDLNNGRDSTLDLRGFGESASNNVVVLVDGIRISENELASARLSAIPLSQIERIEIIRGGNSVLWGEGASAGVINVVLKRGSGGVSEGVVSMAGGSDGLHQTMASGQWAVSDAWSLDGALDSRRTQGYRQNSQNGQDVVSLGAQWQQGGWLARARVQHEQYEARLPGGLTLAQFQADPRQTLSPDDFGYLSETRYTAHLARSWGPWLAQLDMGQRERASTYAQFGDVKASRSEQTQVSPRLTAEWHAGAAKVSTTVGVDMQRWDFRRRFSAGVETADQRNTAWFIHNDVVLDQGTRINLGAREERVTKRGDFPGGFPPAVTYERRDVVRASELGINQSLNKQWDVYGRLAASYRLANVDENRQTPSAGPLRPQRSQDREVGVKWAENAHRASVRLFRQSTTDEITYVATVGANTNTDPIRRQGMEFEGHWQASARLGLSATFQQISAKYRAGPYQGKQVVLVAPQTATLRANYHISDRQTVNVGVQHMGAMFTQDDPLNQCSRKVPASTLLDARYAWTDQRWTVALSGTNLADRPGYNFDFACTGGYVYPFAGRELKLTISRQF